MFCLHGESKYLCIWMLLKYLEKKSNFYNFDKNVFPLDKVKLSHLNLIKNLSLLHTS